MVVLHLLGQCVIDTPCHTLTPRAPVLFQVALHCITECGRRVPRDRVAQWLWPTHASGHAAHRLRSAVSRLRHLGVPIRGDGHMHPHLWIDRADVRTDDAWIATAAAHELLQRDLRVLPGYAPRGAPALHDWIDEYRRRVFTRIVNTLRSHAATARVEGEWELAHAIEQRMAAYNTVLTTNGTGGVIAASSHRPATTPY